MALAEATGDMHANCPARTQTMLRNTSAAPVMTPVCTTTTTVVVLMHVADAHMLGSLLSFLPSPAGCGTGTESVQSSQSIPLLT